MTLQQSEQLLRQARRVLATFLFDGETLRDDVAGICMEIDDLLPEATDLSRQAIESMEDAA